MKTLIYLTILVFSVPSLWAGDAGGTSGISKPSLKNSGGNNGKKDRVAPMVDISELDSTENQVKKGEAFNKNVQIQLIAVTFEDTLIFTVKSDILKSGVFEASLAEVESNKPALTQILIQSMDASGAGIIQTSIDKAEGQVLQAELKSLTHELPSDFEWNAEASLNSEYLQAINL